MPNAFLVHACAEQLARQGLSVPALAQLLEIDEPYLRRILRGEIAARPSLVPVLAQVLGQDPKAWVFETEALPQIDEIQALFPRQWRAYLEAELDRLTRATASSLSPGHAAHLAGATAQGVPSAPTAPAGRPALEDSGGARLPTSS
jgi:transcriptional regulator with XRE-family HTH domain